MKLKVCGMKHQANMEALLDVQPDFMGMIFYAKSARNVDDSLDSDFVRGLDQVVKVGVFVNETEAFILEKVQQYDLHMIQLHGAESPDLCAALKAHRLKVIKVFSIGNGFDFDRLEPYEEVVDYFLFDTKGKHPGGNGVVFNWDILAAYPSSKPFFLSGGIGPESIDKLKALNMEQLYAIDVNSRFELEPGLKDIEMLREFQKSFWEEHPSARFRIGTGTETQRK